MRKSNQAMLAGFVLASAACFLTIRWPSPPDLHVPRPPAPAQSGPHRENAAPARSPVENSPKEKIELLNAKLNQERVNHGSYESDAVTLLKKWAESDPAAALRFSLLPLEDDEISGIFLAGADEVMSVWARRAPDDARHFLESSVTNPSVIRQLAPAVMHEYARHKPSAAIAWVTSGIASDSGELRPALALELVKVFEQIGRGSEIRAWLCRPDVANTAYAREAIVEFSAELSSRNPHEALRFAMDLPPGSMSRGIACQETFRRWTELDPSAAFRCLSEMVRTYEAVPPADVSHDEGAQPATGINADELDHATAGYVIGRSNLEETLADVASIQDPSLRKRVERILEQR